MTTDPADHSARAEEAVRSSGIDYVVTRHARVGSLAEAAALRGVEPSAIVKTLVVRRADGDFVFVLVPGDREIAWPKLRALLGVNRLSLPSAEVAFDATGYERGTITPFGSYLPWPVVADERLVGRQISVGGGAHGVAITLAANDALRVLEARIGDVTDQLGEPR